MKVRTQNKGIALVTALLITALTAIVATGMAADSALDARRTMVLLFHEQGKLVATGAEAWVRNILSDDIQSSQDSDHLGEIWAQELPVLPVDNGSIQGAVAGEIVDLQGRFNVNMLIDVNGKVNDDYKEQFTNLLRILELDERYADLAVDWLDPDSNAELQGAEDPIYTAGTPAYRTYNRGLSNVTELAALNGMTRDEFERLRPHITALPTQSWKINVNTASAAVLRSFDPIAIDEGLAEALIEQRAADGFTDPNVDFGDYVPQKLKGSFDGVSSYFQLKAVVQIDTVRVTYFSVLHRGAGGTVTVMLRSLGTT